MKHIFHGVELPAMLLTLAIGILGGVGFYTFYYAKGTSYLSNDPTACINCHVMREHYDSWVKSSHHAAATCNDCHVPHTFPEKYLAKMKNGWNHSRAFTLQDWPEPIRITSENLADLQHNCLHCHDVFTSPIASHREIQKAEFSCTRCHSTVGHMVSDY